MAMLFDPGSQQWYDDASPGGDGNEFLGHGGGDDDWFAQHAPPPQVNNTAAPTQGAGPQNGDFQGWFNQLTSGRPHTPAELVALEGQLGQHGVKVLRNAAGVAGKIQLPDGRIIDVIEKAGEGGRAWQWLEGGGGGAAGGNTVGADPNFGSTPAPYTSPTWQGGDFTPPPLPGELAKPYEAPAPYTAPQWTDHFKPVTADELTADPSYLVRQRAAQDAVERGAAGRGSVLSGGTIKATQRNASELASMEYGAADARKFRNYAADMGAFDANAARGLAGYQTNVATGLAGRQQNQGEYQQNQLMPAWQSYLQRYQTFKDSADRGLSDYLTNWNVKRTGETDYWSRLMDLQHNDLTANQIAAGAG